MANDKQNSSSAHKLLIGAAVASALLVTLAIVISVVCLYKRRVMAGPKFLMRNYSITRSKYTLNTLEIILHTECMIIYHDNLHIFSSCLQ